MDYTALYPTRWYSSIILSLFPEVPGSIPGAPRFSEKQWVWNGVHSLVRTTEELLGRNSSGSGQENRD
jgi:hypothetical protein